MYNIERNSQGYVIVKDYIPVKPYCEYETFDEALDVLLYLVQFC